jgi:hypothetical protein
MGAVEECYRNYFGVFVIQFCLYLSRITRTYLWKPVATKENDVALLEEENEK